MFFCLYIFWGSSHFSGGPGCLGGGGGLLGGPDIDMMYIVFNM